MLKFIRLMLVIVITMCGWETVSYGQIPRYTSPSGSPLPSQLNYFKRDSGVLDTYNGIVEPQRMIARQFNQQARTNVQLQQELVKSKSELDQIRESEANVTGAGAGFMNSKQYFMNSSGAANIKSGTPRKYTFSKTPRANANQANANVGGTGS